jgi:sec-independent protein translocase protein TatC
MTDPSTGPAGADTPETASVAVAAPETSALAGVMPLIDHLAELRTRLVWAVVAVVVGSLVGFYFSADVIAVLRAPIPKDIPLVVTGMGDAFAIRLRIAVVAGVILAMPVWLFHLWRFISPGLTPRERRTVLPWIPAALFFFALGVGVAYIVIPFAAQFLLSFLTEDLQPLLTIREYFDFVTTLFLAFGLLMEFPIVLVGLSRVGIVTSERLSRSRRLVILGIAIFSAAATPGGDLVSPTVLGVTLYVLFELTVVAIRRSGR